MQEYNEDEDIVKTRFAIRRLEMAAVEELIERRSEAFKYGAEILRDYLKYLILKK